MPNFYQNKINLEVVFRFPGVKNKNLESAKFLGLEDNQFAFDVAYTEDGLPRQTKVLLAYPLKPDAVIVLE